MTLPHTHHLRLPLSSLPPHPLLCHLSPPPCTMTKQLQSVQEQPTLLLDCSVAFAAGIQHGWKAVLL